MILSILICSLEDRSVQLSILKAHILSQMMKEGVMFDVEVITDVDSRQITTGAKRNRLLQRATGLYSVFIDDDDEISEDYISLITSFAGSGADCITFNGYMTTNGQQRMPFNIALNNPYILSQNNGVSIYLRFPNHICPIKTDIARQVQFQDICFMEDYKWANEIREKGLLKTEAKIEKELYHYKFITNKQK